MQGEVHYLELLEDVLKTGVRSANRTGIGTFKVFGRFWECNDVENSFPLLTTKRVHWKSVVAELLWFLSGSTNVKDLQKLGCTIWDEWADEKTGELGPVYGKQWRNWFVKETHVEGPGGYDGHTATVSIDQINAAVGLLKTEPDSRRIVVSAWNVGDLNEMALLPCHYAFQLQHCNGELSMMVNMRSIDIFLGLPFNIASYALLLKMFAHVTGYRAKRLCFSLGDLHLYENHVEQARIQLSRKSQMFLSPIVKLKESVTCMGNFSFDAIELLDYQHHPAIKGEVAV